jgi:site-specific recombinase XerD
MKPDTAISPSDRAPKLLTQVVNTIRIRHYSIRTDEAYVHWVKAYIRFHGLRHPRDMGAREVTKFLSHLASERDVAAATQQQALSALLFLYRHVLEIDLPWPDDLVRPKKPARLPTVLNHDEVARLLAVVRPEQSLMVRLLYGTGMRLMECLRLRVKDVDFVRGEIMIR